jgi:hypothetical protein
MAVPEAHAGGPRANAGPAPVVVDWPLAGCRLDSLTDLFSPRALAELARVAGPAGGAVALDLCGHVLQAPAGGRRAGSSSCWRARCRRQGCAA